MEDPLEKTHMRRLYENKEEKYFSKKKENIKSQ